MRKTAEVGNGPSARQNRVASDPTKHTNITDDDGHDHSDGGGNARHNVLTPAAASLLALLIALGLDNYFPRSWFAFGWLLRFDVAAYLPVGFAGAQRSF